MNRISVLDSLLISKIAAGEVVQGVYSVVKELMENSLDSGADQISVLLVGGGLESIVVKDNGSGIYPPDLPMAVERFASSKVQNLDSLLHLQTYGFRGEALSSIAAVSRFKIVSNWSNNMIIQKCLLPEGFGPDSPVPPPRPVVCF